MWNSPRSRRLKKGKQLNIIGTNKANKNFNYALSIGSFNKKDLVKILEKEIDKSEKLCKEERINVVIILNKDSVHTSSLIKAQLEQ